MIQAISPVSFQAKAKYKATRKFTTSKGEKLALKIKAASHADKTYRLDVTISDKDDLVKGAYTNSIGKKAPANTLEYFQSFYDDLKKLECLFERYEIKDSGKIIDNLLNFFAKASEEVIV